MKEIVHFCSFSAYREFDFDDIVSGKIEDSNVQNLDEGRKKMDQGFDFYAPQTTLLPDGRRVMIAWMKSWDSCVIKEKQRWQGMMTLPRELEYRDGKIWQKPVREIENYRKNR